MLKVLRLIFGLTVLAFAIYGLVTGKSSLIPYMFFFMGAMSFVIGLSEFQLKRKRSGYISILLSILMFYVSVKGFFWN